MHHFSDPSQRFAIRRACESAAAEDTTVYDTVFVNTPGSNKITKARNKMTAAEVTRNTCGACLGACERPKPPCLCSKLFCAPSSPT